MRILDRSVYVGPSLYARFPGHPPGARPGRPRGLAHRPLGAGFVDALAAALPGLAEHGCSYNEPGGFLRRMREDEGTWLGHVLEHVAIELQNIAGEEVTFGKTRSGGAARRLHRRLRICAARRGHRRRRARACGCCARCCPRRSGRPTRCPRIGAGRRRAMSSSASRSAARSGPSTASLVRAAEQRGIPWLRLNDQSLVQLGHGKYQQRIQATVTGRTSHIAVELASDKEETNKILATLGLPVPKQELVQNEEQAVRAAQRIGFPVVTKPYNGNHGRGISIRLTTDEEVAQGFAVAREHSRSVIVETFFEGDDHRLLVVNGELVAATRRTPGHVVGDGEHTIAQLIEIVNQDPRRGVGHEKVLTRLELDAQAQKMLERAGLQADSIPEHRPGGLPALDGESVHRRNRDRRDRRHPSGQSRNGGARGTRHRPGRRRRGLPLQGHHRELSHDRRRHLRGERGARLSHARGAERRHGSRRRRAGHRHAVSAGRSARVPIAAITGTNGKTTTARMLAHHHQDGRLHAGTDHHRRRLHRRPAHRAGRHDRTDVGAHGAGGSADRYRHARDRARRLAARRHGGARSQRRRACSTCSPTTSA